MTSSVRVPLVESGTGWEKLLTAVRNRTSIPADLRELGILRMAVLNRATFEFDAHMPDAVKAGISPEKIDAVHLWPVAGVPRSLYQCSDNHASAYRKKLVDLGCTLED